VVFDVSRGRILKIFVFIHLFLIENFLGRLNDFCDNFFPVFACMLNAFFRMFNFWVQFGVFAFYRMNGISTFYVDHTVVVYNC